MGMSTNIEHIGERHLLEVESGGAATEAFGGLTVVILTILGLVGLAPEPLVAIAGIVFGVAILAQGAAIAAEYTELFSKTNGAMGTIELGGGMTVEITAGVAAIVLGILALLGMIPQILMPALVITGGAALILTAGSLQRLNRLKVTTAEKGKGSENVLRATTSGAAGGQLLSGVAAIVLGIIAFASMPSTVAMGAAHMGGNWLTLVLVGLLVLGSSIMLSGGALVGRLTQMFDTWASQQ
jgi:hypothetical protein